MLPGPSTLVPTTLAELQQHQHPQSQPPPQPLPQQQQQQLQQQQQQHQHQLQQLQYAQQLTRHTSHQQLSSPTRSLLPPQSQPLPLQMPPTGSEPPGPLHVQVGEQTYGFSVGSRGTITISEQVQLRGAAAELSASSLTCILPAAPLPHVQGLHGCADTASDSHCCRRDPTRLRASSPCRLRPCTLFDLPWSSQPARARRGHCEGALHERHAATLCLVSLPGCLQLFKGCCTNIALA